MYPLQAQHSTVEFYSSEVQKINLGFTNSESPIMRSPPALSVLSHLVNSSCKQNTDQKNTSETQDV